jgi:hypothetical protein
MIRLTMIAEESSTMPRDDKGMTPKWKAALHRWFWDRRHVPRADPELVAAKLALAAYDAEVDLIARRRRRLQQESALSHARPNAS